MSWNRRTREKVSRGKEDEENGDDDPGEFVHPGNEKNGALGRERRCGAVRCGGVDVWERNRWAATNQEREGSPVSKMGCANLPGTDIDPHQDGH